MSDNGNQEQQYMQLVEKYMKDSTPLPLTMEVSAAWMLVSGLQLLNRHPGISPMMKQEFEHIGRLFQDAICDYDMDAWRFLEMGWHEQYDVPRDDEGQ